MPFRSKRDPSSSREEHEDWRPSDLFLDGQVPNLSASDFALFRVRLFDLVGELVRTKRVGPFRVSLGYGDRGALSNDHRGQDPNPAAKKVETKDDRNLPNLIPMEPMWRFDQLVLPRELKEILIDCVSFVEVAPLVFDTWNLRSIEPHPSIAINFRGPPGTGKTMAAHGVAEHLGRKILSSRLSDLESKYHGDGPKNIVNLFRSASAQNAVLFIDEAESLLSRRFAQPDQAAESAINSMRTELLMALDSFDGLVIFATNLPGSYDTAISSRLTHVDFPTPAFEARLEIWRKHLPAELPLDQNVDLESLALIEGVTGRDIKRAILGAAVATARRQLPYVSQDLLASFLRQYMESSEDQGSTSTPRMAHSDLGEAGSKIREQLAKRDRTVEEP